MSTPEQKATWARLAEGATPGPWYADEWDDDRGRFIPLMGGGPPGSSQEHCIGTVQSYGQPEDECESVAAFIAAAREAVPSLLAENAEQAERIEELQREQARLHGEIMALEDEIQFHQVGDGYEAGRLHSEQAHMAKIATLRAENQRLMAANVLRALEDR